MRRTLALALLGLVSAPVFATEHYTEARITQIETGPTTVLLFLQVVSGDAPPIGNGGTNEPLIKPYIFLASSADEVNGRKHLLSNAFVALTKQSVVRFRWDDAGPTGALVIAMLVRS